MVLVGIRNMRLLRAFCKVLPMTGGWYIEPPVILGQNSSEVGLSAAVRLQLWSLDRPQSEDTEECLD